MVKVFTIAWLSVLLAGIAFLFWHTDWVYNQPTPVPKNYNNVPTGQHIDIASTINLSNGQPVLFHFYNPDCPCSKFNAAYFKSLVQQYGNEVKFVIVPITQKKYTVKEIQNFYGLRIPVLFDTSLVRRCGVYSTPQAVIIDAEQKLYYRGNYNRSRYCTDKKTNYASMALDSLLKRKPNPLFDRSALVAYGCKLPVTN